MESLATLFHILEFGISQICVNISGHSIFQNMEFPIKPLRPQDIFLLLALVAKRDRDNWTYDRLAEELGMSASQVFRSLKRMEGSHLFDRETRRVRRLELLEFLSHGIRYAFAAVPQGIQRGVPTCWKAPGLGELIKSSKDEPFVWPAPNGMARGQAIEPLHSGALMASGENGDLYRLLALTDILRVGSARERRVAAEELEKALR